MKARIKDLAWSRDGESLLTIATGEDLRKLFDDLHECDVEVSVKKFRKKRSKDANSLYWLLCGKLAQKMNVSPEDIYHRHIKDIGNYETLCIREDAVETFTERWSSGHLGRFCATRKSKFDGYTVVLAYYGSSDFDTKQMSHLIDNLMQDCKAVGIETLPPEEVERLKEEWR